MKVLLQFFIVTFLCWWFSAFAAEVDSITPRNLMLEDALEDINSIINRRIKQGVANANDDFRLMKDISNFPIISKDNDCDEDELYTELRKALFQSFTASWGLKGYDLDMQLRELLFQKSYALSLSDSIYRDITLLEGFSLNLKELSHLVNINGYLVGMDKLGHFFAQGWQYFEISNKEGQSLDDALAWGQEKESGLYGYTTTGIYSFADLAANFDGWRFWNRVLFKQSDPVKGFFSWLFQRSYVNCKIQFAASFRQLKLVRAWEVTTDFDLADYINAAWDEGINCNSYANTVIALKVNSRINEVASGFSCPVNPMACIRARKNYGKYAQRLLHPLCYSVR